VHPCTRSRPCIGITKPLKWALPAGCWGRCC
jgi:hypothetical protein